MAEDWASLVAELAADATSDRVALEAGDRQLTIRALADAMLRAGAALDDGGRGAPVLVSCADPLDHAVAVLGACAAGRPALLVPAATPDAAVAEVAGRSGATVAVGRTVAGLPSIAPEELRAGPPLDRPRPAPADALGSILMTSGSTGVPKLVLRTRGADLHAAMCLRLARFPIGPGDRHWLAVPFAAAPFLTLVMGSLLAGATVVFAPFHRTAVEPFLAERQISSAYLVPTMLRLAREHDGLDGPGWRGLRGLMTGGERLDRPTAELLLDRFAGRVFCAYGMTECPRLAEASFEEIAERPGTVGRPIPLRRVRIVEPGGDRRLPSGEEGEVLVGGPDLYRGYLGDEPAGDWHRTGDLGRLDDDGFLYITGRASAVVNVGGNRVSTEDVATVLRSHPDVAQAAVVAVDDDRFTTRLEAFAVLRPGSAADPDALRAWLGERLTSYQVPRGLRVVDDLPVDGSGKVSLQTLRSMAVT